MNGQVEVGVEIGGRRKYRLLHLRGARQDGGQLAVHRRNEDIDEVVQHGGAKLTLKVSSDLNKIILFEWCEQNECVQGLKNCPSVYGCVDICLSVLKKRLNT